jgi:hypothetical protein
VLSSVAALRCSSLAIVLAVDAEGSVTQIGACGLCDANLINALYRPSLASLLPIRGLARPQHIDTNNPRVEIRRSIRETRTKHGKCDVRF